MSFINSIKNWFHNTFTSSNNTDTEDTETQSSNSKPAPIVFYPNGSVKPLSQVEQSSNTNSKNA